MLRTKPNHLTSRLLASFFLAAALAAGTLPARAQAPAPTAPTLIPGAVVRRVVMKDALSAETFRTKLETMKASGLFRDRLPGIDPKQPVQIDISFLTSG